MSRPASLGAPLAVVPPLLTWGATNLRDLPWRDTRDPWAILVSEVMLQQTQAERVVDRWRSFLDRFPTPRECAEAPLSDVIGEWAGLGYNRRGVNLWRTANRLVEDHQGALPRELDALLALPGVGPYTARAVLVFAFEEPVGVVDTNVGRLLARWVGGTLPPRVAQRLADELVPAGEAWHWTQTLFDFAVAVCAKRTPACTACPISDLCAWRGEGPDPADSSAGVSTRQSAFEGSFRQVRGRVVDRLRAGPATRDALDAEIDDERLDAVLASLERDGLVVLDAENVELPAT